MLGSFLGVCIADWKIHTPWRLVSSTRAQTGARAEGGRARQQLAGHAGAGFDDQELALCLAKRQRLAAQPCFSRVTMRQGIV